MIRVLFLTSTLLLGTAISAQYQFGVVAGPQYVNTRMVLDMDLPVGVELPKMNGPGYHLGVWYRSDPYHMVQFRAGLNWAYRTFSTEVNTEEITVDTATLLMTRSKFVGHSYYRLNYLELPVQAQYYFWKGAHAELGVYFARRIYGNIRTAGQRSIHYPDGTVFRPDDVNDIEKDLSALARFEFGASIGVGADFRSGLTLGLGYTRSLSRMEEAKTLAATYVDQLRLNLGYDFLRPKGRRVYRRAM